MSGSSGSVAGDVKFADMANAIRALSMDAVQAAKSGHPGMPMGMADAATVLFTEFLKFDPQHPDWPARDRFVLSAGHGSMLIYSLLYLTGYPDSDIDQLRNFRQYGSRTAGHPEFGHLSGIETTTGPLGQGIANAVGMALAERMWNARVGDAIENYTYCIAGDGCLMEGISHEAISMAGHLGLGRLIVLFDDNGISIDGATSLAVSDDQAMRFEASGWHTLSADGHDPDSVRAALKSAQAETSKPTMIAVKTVIGQGSPNKAGTAGAHGAPLGPDEIALAREQLGWPHAPFEIPEDVLSAWRAAGARGAGAYASWQKQWAGVDAAARAAFENPMNDDIRGAVKKAVQDHKKAIIEEGKSAATRVWSQHAIEALLPVIPGLVGGSADLTGSNNTLGKGQPLVKPGEFGGSYIHYGVREHGMAAAMNGLALYGGIIPYGGTFLVFTDYCRPSIRLSALMGLGVVYVMTHDSIGLGEDGPTHQPVEHVAGLRIIPNLNVFRPACGVETAECWELAVANSKTPSVLALSRQSVVNGREYSDDNLSARGGYVRSGDADARDVTLIATGTEIGLALEAAGQLAEKGIKAAVVSMPCVELFRGQDAAYQAATLGNKPRVIVEAGVQAGWEEWMQPGDVFVGMSTFGMSAPAAQVYEHFGITAEAVVGHALSLAAK
jgi:transketolase